MGYEMMWSEKYRPRTLDEILGHEEIIKRLKGFIGTNSLPHLLFAGPAGTGKTSAVIALAYDLFGYNNLQGNLFELNASDDRGIDVIRNQVKEFARVLPANDAPFKIIILDEADALTTAAQHALRRTMERYVNTSRFVLLCNYPGKIIEPIQSRCAYFRFSKINQKDIIENLTKISKSEGVKYKEEGIQTIIDIAEGDMRKSINILQATASIGGEITKKNVFETVGTIDKSEVIEIMLNAKENEYGKAKDKLQKLIYVSGIDGQDILKHIYNNLEILKLSTEGEMKLMTLISEIDFRLTEGASADIQIATILANIGILK